MRSGTPDFVAESLIEARLARGLRQLDLAQQLDISRQAVWEYERSRSTPGPRVFKRMTEVLQLPAQFFLSRPTDLIQSSSILFRSRRSATTLQRERAKVRLRWAVRVAAYSLAFVDFPALDLPEDLLADIPHDPRRLSDHQIDRVAIGLREHWGLMQEPISHVIRLLESKGIIVTTDALQAPSIDALTAWPTGLGHPAVLLNRDISSSVRIRFTAAHELGELCLHRHVDPSLARNKEIGKLLEQQAHQFAGTFLLPEEAFLGDLYDRSLIGILKLKRRWKVSVAMMINHLYRLGVLSSDGVSRLYKELSRRRWRTVEPLDDQLPVEEPVLLKQAFEMILAEELQSRYDIVENTGLDSETLCELANVPSDFFDRNELPSLRLGTTRRNKQSVYRQPACSGVK